MSNKNQFHDLFYSLDSWECNNMENQRVNIKQNNQEKRLISNTFVFEVGIYIIMIGHQNLKSRSRASSSSSGSGKFLLPETIEFKVSREMRSKDLFQRLLDESSIMEEENREDCFTAMHLINELNLSPRQHHQQGCKCTKIDCLKLYCECFAKGKTCNESCICVCCHNTVGNEQEILKAKSVVNYRQPNYFKGVPSYVPARKCTCKKSLCQKKYCQCYNAGLKCTQDCECCDCHNGKPDINSNFDSRMEIQVRA